MKSGMNRKRTQWLVYRRDEAYEKSISKYESVFLFKEPDGWCAWYGRWNPKYFGEKPASQFDIVTGATFEVAVRKANEFIERHKKRGGTPDD